MAHRHRASKIWFGIGGVLLVAGLLWTLVAVPALVKYPTDVDSSPRYAGTFTLFVNPANMSPLAEPMKLPLSVDRHVEAIASESSSTRVVVRETIRQKAGDLVDTTQRNQYVMDRSSLENVKDPRAYAFTPTNVVDRSGTYRLNMPFHTDTDKTYPIYKNEIGGPYRMKPTRVEKVELEGLSLSRFSGVLTDHPFSAAYLAQLRKSLPLPETTTFDALRPRLTAAGFDVDAVLAELGPLLTATEAATLTAVLAKPIPLEYTLSFDGAAAVELTTGAQVQVGSRDTYGVRPKLARSDVDAVLAVVDAHTAQVPALATAAAVLRDLSRLPSIPLAEFAYDQTPASIAAVADDVKASRRAILLVERTIPLGLAVLGGVALLVGGVLWPRGSRMAVPAGRAAPTHA